MGTHSPSLIIFLLMASMPKPTPQDMAAYMASVPPPMPYTLPRPLPPARALSLASGPMPCLAPTRPPAPSIHHHARARVPAPHAAVAVTTSPTTRLALPTLLPLLKFRLSLKMTWTCSPRPTWLGSNLSCLGMRERRQCSSGCRCRDCRRERSR